MGKIKDKIICCFFAGFLALTLLCTVIFNFSGIKTTLSEIKDKIFNVRASVEYLNDLKSGIEQTIDDNIFLKDKYIDLYGGLQRAMFKDIIWDKSSVKTIMRGSDGKLYSVGNVTQNFSDDITVNYDALNTYAENLKALDAYLKNKNSDLLYVQAPSRYDSAHVTLPLETLNDSEIKNIDYFCSQIRDEVNLVNTQDLYKTDGLRFEDMFFKTDHHWTVKTAFWAFGQICSYLNEKNIVNIDESLYSINSYDVKTIKNCYLGSYGVITGRFFAGTDDFDFISPKFETSFKKTISKYDNKLISTGGGYEKSGDFKQAVMSYYPDKNEVTEKIIFGSYVSSDRSEVIIENNNPDLNKKVLIIKDSFSLPVSAFLSNCFKETRMIDLRVETEKTAKEYIDEYNPDLVVVLYNPGAFRSQFFNFGI